MHDAVLMHSDAISATAPASQPTTLIDGVAAAIEPLLQGDAADEFVNDEHPAVVSLTRVEHRHDPDAMTQAGPRLRAS